MKQMVCEMCGGTEIQKDEGVFVCRCCGCKYSVDEAKKLLIDVTIDVSGSTVKVDTSEDLKNLYQIARRAKNENNGENASRYYDMILVKDPTSWEASFFVVYFKAMECKIAQIRSAGISVANCVDTVLKLINDYVEGKDKQVSAVNEVVARCLTLSDMLYKVAKKHYNEIDSQIQNNYTQEMINNCCAARDIMYILGNSIASIFGEHTEFHPAAVTAWKDGIEKHNGLMHYFAQKDSNKKMIMEYVYKIRRYDSSYHTPEIDTSSGCYVATAVYGSYDCPQVWTLRRYRDYKLAETWHGRLFIHAYYAISPTIVKWHGHTEWFKKMWKGILDYMVKNLQRKGYESTPYEDSIW